MLPIKRLLYLQLYQAETLISSSKKYNFSDKYKDQYLKTLVELFNGIKASINEELDDAKIFEKKNHLDFIFKSLEFLKDSTLNTIPFEVVGCLDRAMSDWIDPEKFIIVTSLQNSLYSFSYDLSYAKNDIFYQSLQTEYGINFERKLIQINLPLNLSKDYLSSVALYHELGHFVDLQHSITSVAAYDIWSGNFKEKASLEKFLPLLKETELDRFKLFYHLGEYFCDLFAAQYIGDTLGLFLEYITSKGELDSPTHPSTVNRIEVISDFVNGNENPLINYLQSVVHELTDKNLENRFDRVTSEDFYALVPYDIQNDRELHGTIVYGWDVWMEDFKKFNDGMKYDVNLSEDTIYRVINNLVEKSIGNYFTVQNWQKSKE